MPIFIRLAQKTDLRQIMSIITEAKRLMKSEGNPQWQNGKPNQAMLTADIVSQRAYCLEVDQKVAGIAILQTTPEPSYTQIAGSWNNNNDQYATIHRIAISTQFRGQHLGQFFMSNLISRGVMLGIKNFRIDTHAVNKSMQKLIKQVGFEYCGIIKVGQADDDFRNAYELNLA